MSKVKDAFANPTPRLTKTESTEVSIARNKYQAIRDELYFHKEEVLRLEEEYQKALKHLVDLRELEMMTAKKVYKKDPDGEYQNLVDNQMMHEEQDNA